MSWQKLLKGRRITVHKTSRQELDGLRAVVERDLKDAAIESLSQDRRFATMHRFKHLTLLQFVLALAVLLATRAVAKAAEPGNCELAIRGHSIRQLTLIERTRRTGVRFDRPGETVQLPPGEYRVEQVELDNGYTLDPLAVPRHDWFQVTREGRNELAAGAPLYPTVAARRHGGFIRMDYSTVDGVGRSYRKIGMTLEERSRPPTFTVSKGGRQIGSGSFEYG